MAIALLKNRNSLYSDELSQKINSNVSCTNKMLKRFKEINLVDNISREGNKPIKLTNEGFIIANEIIRIQSLLK